MSGDCAFQPTWNEEARLKALDSYGILDTQIEKDFEDIAKMAAQVCGTPVSVINFVAKDRQWFKAEIGLGLRETPLDISICAKAILQPGVFTVSDLSKDPRFEKNPLIAGDPRFRFYAGALLETPEGLPIGTMCVLDFKPRTLSAEESETLQSLARQVMTLLELRRALNAKSQSEERLSLALEASGYVGVWEWDITKDRVYADRRFVSAFGGDQSWTTDGAPIAEYVKAIHPEDLPRVKAAIEAAMRPGEAFKQEYRLVQKDGSSLWIEARGKCHFDGAGKPIRFPGVAVDITDRREAQARSDFLGQLTQKLSLLSAPEELNRVVTREVGQFLGGNRCYFFEAIAPDLWCRVLPDWHIPEVQSLQGTYDLAVFGEPEMWETLRTASVCIDDSREHPWTKRFVDNYRAMNIGAAWIAPFCRDGKWVTCLGVSTDTPRRWRQQEREFLENVMSRVWPLIERARIERELREREETLSRIAAVVESSDDAIITKTLQGIITSWNAGAERIFGYKPDEIIGHSILELIPPELQNEEPGIIKRLRKGERIEHYETVRMGKGGRKIDISLTVSPVKDRHGKIVAASKIARDITEEKKRQTTVRESETRFRAELERQVSERTLSLQEAVSQMEAFSYSISHDMRAPLRSMIGFAEILKQECAEKLDETEFDYLNRISNASRRMDQLIQDVLVFSRLSRDEVVLEPVNSDSLLREIIHSYPNLRPDLVTITIKGLLPMVMAKEALLTQCLSNLLDNAIKFTHKGTKPQIEVWSHGREGRSRFFFKDNGIGMSGNHLDRIFDIFHRVGRDNDGTGIGLAIVRKSVGKMGGTVGVESELGKGSLFWLELRSA